MNQFNNEIMNTFSSYEKQYLIVENQTFYRLLDGVKLFSCSYIFEADKTAVLTLSTALDIFRPLEGQILSLDGCNGTNDDKTTRVLYLYYKNSELLKNDILTILNEII